MATNPVFPCQQVGEFFITALSDGYLAASLDLLSDIDPAEAARLQAARRQEPSAVHINTYLVRGRGRTVLIDAGAGGFKGWGGQLPQRLALAGVAPSEIDTVLLTHAHPDHVGGLVDGSGACVFPNAELLVHRAELDFWQDDNHLGRASERGRGNFLVARRAFDAYRAALRPIGAGEVVPGIEAVPLPGHTAGHTGYRFDSEGRSLLVWGDIVHFPHIQVARPEVSIAFDQDPMRSASTRARLLDLVSAERMMVAGMHLGELGFARIERTGAGYEIAYQPGEGFGQDGHHSSGRAHLQSCYPRPNCV
ncbi:MBL fold metallo-hydrolase [Paracidovorax avenae]|uniref:MBL fold metallo-hydrolase n=1 Tax=Paracidovorax avenae TaxID=80867 RepID=UPI001CEF79BF|nr:MBL fold metallo-hydrolase [Paracidovorax avenae]